MATQKKKTSKTKNTQQPSEMEKTVILPSVNAAVIISEYSASLGELDMAALFNALSDSMSDVSEGNMKRCEAMLLGQAYALQSIFMNLSRRAIKQEYLKNYDVFLKLGLKAQSQCRATLETLAMIKNPPIVYAKQANIAQGHQQVNNGTPPPHPISATRAEKNKFDQNELLEIPNEQRLEYTETGTPSHYHPKLEAVEAGNRTDN